MADLITTGTSGYATGSIDTATVLVNNVSPTDAKHPNGLAQAVVQIEGILGSGTTLIGTATDLGARLAVTLTPGGAIASTGSATITDTDSRTATVQNTLQLTGLTTGTPAAGIGTGIHFRAESADEAPSNFGQIDFSASDITAGSEDTYFRVWLRVAGAALTEAYRWVATTAFNAIFTHANSADRTYTLPNVSGTIIVHGQADVSTADLKTATGSATATATTGAPPVETATDITRNDYAFDASYTYSVTAGSTGTLRVEGQDTADPSSTVARSRVRLVMDTAPGTTTGVIRWRYMTATDNPEMWVAYDPATGKIVSTWASDDPTPDGSPGVSVPGMVSLRLTAKDLESFTALSAKAQDASDYIKARKLKPKHQAYRALQLHTGDKAPSRWLLNECQVNTTTGVIEPYVSDLKGLAVPNQLTIPGV